VLPLLTVALLILLLTAALLMLHVRHHPAAEALPSVFLLLQLQLVVARHM
jgi:hypothetical protein